MKNENQVVYIGQAMSTPIKTKRQKQLEYSENLLKFINHAWKIFKNESHKIDKYQFSEMIINEIRKERQKEI